MTSKITIHFYIFPFGLFLKFLPKWIGAVQRLNDMIFFSHIDRIFTSHILVEGHDTIIKQYLNIDIFQAINILHDGEDEDDISSSSSRYQQWKLVNEATSTISGKKSKKRVKRDD
jgi:hypothetical protein